MQRDDLELEGNYRVDNQSDHTLPHTGERNAFLTADLMNDTIGYL